MNLPQAFIILIGITAVLQSSEQEITVQVSAPEKDELTRVVSGSDSLRDSGLWHNPGESAFVKFPNTTVIPFSLESVKYGAEVIILFSNFNCAPLLLNAVLSILRTVDSIPVNLLTVAMDLETFHALSAISLPVWFPSMFKSAGNSNVQGIAINKTELLYGTSEFGNAMRLTTLCIGQLLGSGYNVFVSDVDVVWLKDPFKEILSLSERKPIQIGGNSPLNFNTGYYRIDSTEETRIFWERSLPGCQEGDDQACFNAMIRKHSMQNMIHYLSIELFPTTGCLWDKMKNEDHTRSFVFHASCRLGACSKWDFFRREDMFQLIALRKLNIFNLKAEIPAFMEEVVKIVAGTSDFCSALNAIESRYSSVATFTLPNNSDMGCRHTRNKQTPSKYPAIAFSQ